MAGRLYYSRGDPDLLKLLVLWEVKKDKRRFELVEGELYLEYIDAQVLNVYAHDLMVLASQDRSVLT